MIYLYELAFDCKEPSVVADFWAAAVGYVQGPAPSPEEIEAALRAHPEWRDRAVREDLPARHPRLYLERVPEPKVGRNRVRFDLGVPGEIGAEIARLQSLGATVLDETSLADPEGNEFVVVPSDGERRLAAVAIDAQDPEAQAAFWARMLRFELHGTMCVQPADWLRVEHGTLVAHGINLGQSFPGGHQPPDGPAHELAPSFRFVPATEPKQRKNRIHLDLVCEVDAIDAQRELAASMGATFEDATTGHRGMFDPEGNEFCLHRPELDT